MNLGLFTHEELNITRGFRLSGFGVLGVGFFILNTSRKTKCQRTMDYLVTGRNWME